MQYPPETEYYCELSGTAEDRIQDSCAQPGRGVQDEKIGSHNTTSNQQSVMPESVICANNSKIDAHITPLNDPSFVNGLLRNGLKRVF
jgi:hypothetical protein